MIKTNIQMRNQLIGIGLSPFTLRQQGLFLCSATIIISKQDILEALEKIPPENYLKLFALLKQLQKCPKPTSKEALQNIFALQGCLKDIILSSVELQHKVADLWSQ